MCIMLCMIPISKTETIIFKFYETYNIQTSDLPLGARYKDVILYLLEPTTSLAGRS